MPYDIERFWNWFVSNAERIEVMIETSNSSRLASELGTRVSRLGKGLAWEVGPGLVEPYAFVISPNGMREMLALTEQIVSKAPRVKKWEFHSAKPPKEWDYCFEIYNKRGQAVLIDASESEYTAVAYNNFEFFDITILVKSLPALDKEAREQVGRIIVEGVLGERVFLESIGTVSLVDQVEPQDQERLTNIAELPNHLDCLIRKRRIRRSGPAS